MWSGSLSEAVSFFPVGNFICQYSSRNENSLKKEITPSFALRGADSNESNWRILRLSWHLKERLAN